MSLEIVLREAQVEDIPQIVAIGLEGGTASHWSVRQWLDIFDPQSPPRLVLVAERQDTLPEVCGFLAALYPLTNIPGGDCELENVAVSGTFRRHGIARKMLTALRDKARKRKAARILLEVRPSNHAALTLYLREGFRELARRRAYYHDPIEDALILVQEL